MAPTDDEIQSWYHNEITAQECRIVHSLDIIEEHRYRVELLRMDLVAMEQQLAFMEQNNVSSR